MKPVVGILCCGFDGKNQFVTDTYVRAVRISGGSPEEESVSVGGFFLRTSRSILILTYAMDFCSPEEVILHRFSSMKIHFQV